MPEPQDLPEPDRDAFTKIVDDFHRYGYELLVFHPTSDTWQAQWTPHGETEPVHENPAGHVSALDAAQQAWAKFQSRDDAR